MIVTVGLISPFQGLNPWCSVFTRALPWPVINRPVGAGDQMIAGELMCISEITMLKSTQRPIRGAMFLARQKSSRSSSFRNGMARCNHLNERIILLVSIWAY
jgi:hypothetical protein